MAAARTVAPAAMAPPAARRTNGSKVGELCALLGDAASAEFLSFAIEAGALALRGREAGVADRAKPAVVLEVWMAGKGPAPVCAGVQRGGASQRG